MMDLTNPVVVVALIGVVGTFLGFLGLVAGLIAARPLQQAMAKKTTSEADSLDASTLVQTRTVYGEMLKDQQGQIKSLLAQIETQQLQIEQQAKRLTLVEAEQTGTATASAKLVDGLNLNIVGLTKQVADLTKEVTGLKTLMEGANETIREANETIKKHGETILALNKEVSGLKSLMEGANETIVNLKQLVSDLIGQIRGLGEVPVAAETAARE